MKVKRILLGKPNAWVRLDIAVYGSDGTLIAKQVKFESRVPEEWLKTNEPPPGTFVQVCLRSFKPKGKRKRRKK